MLTGASGDGKSSLVYAGIIPNARAGFLKSRYSNWRVADFRPERDPLRNIGKAIANALNIEHASTVDAELRHGFSALVDLYKNSKCFVDTDSNEWNNASEQERLPLKRSACNLIILADQFEEFFTNPENYHRGVPSPDSSLVLNILLETARIAFEEDLPIYVVFTMRSDYIGQCAAFRGLPEYIGFSQFFVPRLNRTQLQNVIEEPALLSGNKITRRLTERLIYDLKEGVDQLPILQHTLNQIWVVANNGQEEMDLVHYAMVGGVSKNELPDDQIKKFEIWFEELQPVIKKCYLQPSLQNVLDTHANIMYEEAHEYYLSKTGKQISAEDSKSIIKTTFKCLTKIDQSRAVRNRMTLEEVHHVLGREDISLEAVGSVVTIFREPGNTFVRPFILHEGDATALKMSDILDITHESLIRNWRYLESWAAEEHDNYLVYLDFEQQLNRWVTSGKSNDFLLPIGPLTYFEDWYNQVNPNAWWIARYLPHDTNQKVKLREAENTLRNAQDFLRKSARKHTVTRTVMRYGPRRIAAVFALVAILTLSAFGIRNYMQRQDSYVLNNVKQQAFAMANNDKMAVMFNTPLLMEFIKTGGLSITEVANEIEDPLQRVNIVNAMATVLVMQGRNEPEEEIYKSLFITDSLLAAVPLPKDIGTTEKYLKEMIDLRMAAGFAYQYNPNPKIKEIVDRNAKRLGQWVNQIIKEQPTGFSEIKMLSLGLEVAINNKMFSKSEITTLLEILSPFENKDQTKWVTENFQRDKLQLRGAQDYGSKFNGLYQELAYLYAANGNAAMALACMDSVLAYNQNYFQGDYATFIDNANNVAMVFYTYDHDEALDQFVAGYCQKKGTTPVDLYWRLVSRMVSDNGTNGNFSFYPGEYYSNLNVVLASDQAITYFFEKLRTAIGLLQNQDERNFGVAMAYKNEGIINAIRYEMRINVERPTQIDQQFAQAIAYYTQVSASFLLQPQSVVTNTITTLATMPRSFQFLSPDYRVPFHPFESRLFLSFYNSAAFIQYILEQKKFDLLYKDEDLRYFEMWFSDYHASMFSGDFMLRDPMSFNVLHLIYRKLDDRNAQQVANLNPLYLHLANRAFDLDSIDLAMEVYKKIQPDKLLNSFRYRPNTWMNGYSFELVAKAVANLAAQNDFEEAYRIMTPFRKEVNRSSLYGYAAQLVAWDMDKKEVAIRLLDSAKVEMNKNKNPAIFQPNRHQVAIALYMVDPKNNKEEAYRAIKNSFNKYEAISKFSLVDNFLGDPFKGYQQIPQNISGSDQAGYLTRFMQGYTARDSYPEWNKYSHNEFMAVRRFLPYVNEDE